MKVLLFTHEQDIDGMGSAILGKIAFSDFYYVPCKTFEIDSNFKKYLDNKTIYNYDMVFVTDLCLHEPILSIINEDEVLKNKVVVLDHHKTEKSNDKYDFVNIILECSKGPTSGTYLFFEYLIKNKYLERTDVLEELVELTRQYDTWDWAKYNNKKARMLHLLFEQVGYKKYIEIIENIISNNNTIVFSHAEMEIINDWENKFKQDSKKILEGMIVYPIIIDRVEYKVGYMYTEYKYRNDLNNLVKQNNVYDIDLIGMFFPDMDVISYRGVKDMDVSIVPTYFGGKGHKGAGTNPINNEKFSKVLSKLKFSNRINDNMFIEGLVENDKEKLSKVSKVDIHNHGSYSCTRKFLENNGITIGNEKITNIQTLIEYSRKYITPLKASEQGLYLLLKGNFENCINTGISFVSTNIDFKDCVRTFDSNILRFIEFLKQFEYDNLKIQWIIEISRDSYKIEYKELVMQLINSNFFAGIDLVSTENSVDNSKFVCFYEQANKLGLITKVHAGEQLGPEYIKECIYDFNPREIQHGINIVKDEKVMQLAKEKNITFNVCPSSNLILGYVKSIDKHPIKKMYEFGLKLTIATDDLLYFNNDINDEYLNLYKNNVLTAEELNKIRNFGNSLIKGSDK